jgi:TetR/AcrR family transcriptional repressor of lmrAB and yxaGH operons
VRDGFAKAEAMRLSTLTVSSIEGALILARVQASAQPIDDVAKALAGVLQIKATARKRAMA